MKKALGVHSSQDQRSRLLNNARLSPDRIIFVITHMDDCKDGEASGVLEQTTRELSEIMGEHWDPKQMVVVNLQVVSEALKLGVMTDDYTNVMSTPLIATTFILILICNT
jgi:hypothetical protein